MKYALASLALVAATTFARPAAQAVDYTAIDYPAGTGENLPSYPPIDYTKIDYPPGTGENPPATGSVHTSLSTVNN